MAHEPPRETESPLPEDFPPPPPDPAAEDLWARVLEGAEGEIDASSLRVWFEDVIAVELGSETLTISVPTPFAREYIETRFKAALDTALHQELSETAALHVIVHPGAEHE